MELCVNRELDFQLRCTLVQHVKKTLEAVEAHRNQYDTLSARIVDGVCLPVLEQYLSDYEDNSYDQNCHENGSFSDFVLFYSELAALFCRCLVSAPPLSQQRVDRDCSAMIVLLEQWLAERQTLAIIPAHHLQVLTPLAGFINCLMPYSAVSIRANFVTVVVTLLTHDCASLERFVLRHLVVPLLNASVHGSRDVFSMDDIDRLIGLLIDKHSDDFSAALNAICTLSAQLNFDDTEQSVNQRRLLTECVDTGVWHIQHSARKISRHILQRAVSRRCELNRTVCCNYIPWSAGGFSAEHWSTVFLLLEVLEEKQVHLIEPVLVKFDQLWRSSAVIATPVVLAVLRRALTHCSSYVARWAVIQALRAPRTTESFVCEALVPALNNVSLFLDTDEQHILIPSLSESTHISKNVSLPEVSTPIHPDSLSHKQPPPLFSGNLAPPPTKCGRCLVKFFDSFLGDVSNGSTNSSSSSLHSDNCDAVFTALVRQSWSVVALCHVAHALLCSSTGWSVSAALFMRVCQFVEQHLPCVTDSPHEQIECHRLSSAVRLMLLSVIAGRLRCSARQRFDCVTALCRITNPATSLSLVDLPLLLSSTADRADLRVSCFGNLCRYILWSAEYETTSGGEQSSPDCSESQCVKSAVLQDLHRSGEDPRRRQCLARAVIITLDHQRHLSGGDDSVLDQMVSAVGQSITRCQSARIVTSDMTLLAQLLLTCRVPLCEGLLHIVTQSIRWQTDRNCCLARDTLDLLPFQAGYISALINSHRDLAHAVDPVFSEKAFSIYMASSESAVSSLLFFSALARHGVCLISVIDDGFRRVDRLISAVVQCMSTGDDDTERLADTMNISKHQLMQHCWSAVWCCFVNVMSAHYHTQQRQQQTSSWLDVFDSNFIDQIWSWVEQDLTSCQRHDLLHRLWIMSELMTGELARSRSGNNGETAGSSSRAFSCDVIVSAWRAVQEQRHSHRSDTYQRCVSVFIRLLVVSMATGKSGSCPGSLVEEQLLPLAELSGGWVLLHLLRQIHDLIPYLRVDGHYGLGDVAPAGEDVALARDDVVTAKEDVATDDNSPHPDDCATGSEACGTSLHRHAVCANTSFTHHLFLPVAVAAALHGDVHRRDRRGVDAAHVLLHRVSVATVSRHVSDPSSGLHVINPLNGSGSGIDSCNGVKDQTRLGSDPMFTDRVVRTAGVKALICLSRIDHSAFLLAVERLRHTMTSQRKRHFANSLCHRLQLRASQALLVLHSRLPKSVMVQVYEDCLCLLLTQSLQPSVRRIVQWMAILICYQQPSCLQLLWRSIEQASSVRSGAIGVFVDILYHLAVKMLPGEGATIAEFYTQCFSRLLPWTMAQHFSTRLCCQVALSRIWKLAERCDLTHHLSQFAGVASALNEALTRCNSARNAGLLNSDFFYTHFDPIRCFSLRSIYLHVPRLTHVHCDEWSRADTPLFSDTDCECARSSCSSFICPPGTCCLSGQCPLALLSPTVAPAADCSGNEAEVENEQLPYQSPAAEKGQDSAGTVQRKIAPWRHLAVTDATDVENGVRGRHQSTGPTLVASLIERAPNLGGLCRTCEVFGAGQMTVNSLSVVKDSQFTNLSVSAEKWVSIIEVGRHRLPLYLTEQRSRGRCLVALEQTCDSVCLTRCQLPADCVLVLGNEREGIPAELLPLFDMFVEIPQSGVIRSLNVHVAGALLLWEYARQHRRPAND